jgi:hypothetical protein
MRTTTFLVAILLLSHAQPGLADEVPDFSGFWNAGGRAEQVPELLVIKLENFDHVRQARCIRTFAGFAPGEE